MSSNRAGIRTDIAALTGAVALSVLAATFLFWLSAAPDDYQGRMIVRFDDAPTTRDALHRIIDSGAIPVRAMPFIDAWVVRAEVGSIPALKGMGAGMLLRDLGFDTAFAGCLGIASGPARAPFGATGR